MEEAHLLEFDEFNRVWADQIFLEFDRVTNEKQQAMLVRHVEELEQWTIDEQERVLLRPKFSKQLLQLRTLQESFARVKDYASAERIKVQADSLMSFELSSLKAQWSAAISSKRHRFIDKQRKELAAYLGRRSDERNKLELRKRHELKSEIIQKYKNLQSELDLAHAKERNQAQKFRELGVSGSVILREQAPRNRNPTRASGVDAWRNDQNRPTPVAPTQQKATLGRTRLVSTGMRQRQAQAQSRRTESADSVDGAYSPRPPSTPGFVSSSSSAIPTIASSLDHHSSRPGTGTVDSSSPHAIATPARQTYAHTQQIYTTRPATSHAYGQQRHTRNNRMRAVRVKANRMLTFFSLSSPLRCQRSSSYRPSHSPGARFRPSLLSSPDSRWCRYECRSCARVGCHPRRSAIASNSGIGIDATAAANLCRPHGRATNHIAEVDHRYGGIPTEAATAGHSAGACHSGTEAGIRRGATQKASRRTRSATGASNKERIRR